MINKCHIRETKDVFPLPLLDQVSSQKPKVIAFHLLQERSFRIGFSKEEMHLTFLKIILYMCMTETFIYPYFSTYDH